MNEKPDVLKRYLALLAFAVSFAFVEASVVIYLRAVYYPHGFSFPLVPIHWHHYAIEVTREVATIVMLLAVATLAGKRRLQQAGYFLTAFAVWDIFYYVWLKILLDWPSSLFDWDILFLIPFPWVGPVIAPILISIALLISGYELVRRDSRTIPVRVHPFDAILLFAGTAVMLYSFLSDTNASVGFQMPQSYQYELLAAGLSFWIIAGVLIWRRRK